MEKVKPLIDELKSVAKSHNVDAAQIALAWLITANKETVFAIPGASNKNQVLGNRKAMEVNLSSAEIKKLNSISAFS